MITNNEEEIFECDLGGFIMGAKITGAEYPLCKIFSSEFDFKIPSFQRPYAWTEDESSELFDDLYEFYKNEASDEQYFLGSIVLAKDTSQPFLYDVIDGQQRLTTLTILFALITSKLDGQDRDEFKGYIIEPGKRSQNIESKPRLRLRNKENEFFKKHIQGLKFDELFKLNVESLDTEAKKNILKNSSIIDGRIGNKFRTKDELFDFGSFLVQRCYLVVVSTTSTPAAVRVFSVMNNRGLSLLTTDIIKADIVGAINEKDQIDYNVKWEEMEVELSRDGFNDLFGHIRMIYGKKKAQKSIQDEFYNVVFGDGNSNGKHISESQAIDFIDNVLTPFSEAYNIIKNAMYPIACESDKINDILHWLNRIDNSDWVPVAMLYYKKYKNDALLINEFLRKLERLAAYMRAMSIDVTHRIERYAKILSEIENNDKSNAIELTAEEIKNFIVVLNSDIYTMTAKKRNYLILRLDSFLSDAAATYDNKVLTIEHVLPQTVPAGSQWENWWPNIEERDEWVHKIGNLVPLAKRTNSAARNYDFDDKMQKYFSSKTCGVTSYTLTSQVILEKEWKPETVKRRQKELIEIYKKNWHLY